MQWFSSANITFIHTYCQTKIWWEHKSAVICFFPNWDQKKVDDCRLLQECEQNFIQNYVVITFFLIIILLTFRDTSILIYLCFEVNFINVICIQTNRGWCIKFATGLNIINRHSSKSIIVIKLSFCQNDSPTPESIWSLVYFLNYVYFGI